MSTIMLALPSKGRIQEDAVKVFADAGLPIERPGGARSYLGEMVGMPDVVVRFLSASEIARELIRGTIDIGITGEDLIHETAEMGPSQIEIVKRLGFGRADAVVAVPDAWIDVTAMDDLSDVAADFRARHGRWLKVATKFVNLTRRHFAQAGIAEYRIVESLGATEAAPASGAADLIVDITSTGSTLKANGLRVLEDGVILKSESLLMVARNAEWPHEKLATLNALLDRIGAARFG
ncbi:ATP phosphoribosyltransferase [Pelagibacterium xiamenense]|uniref:ATP phosphoribosyltransferase n=1 Tax=Pelagibacterium xiamenense TaxID=2901140 RepID=UPI001E4A3233|nr:ATP phosphoribosyltransferase [Pelagibacterium xiamenense]MCD7059199.1 ATP phosphoribosyltransferase [Pelagibacterium xiamenense]